MSFDITTYEGALPGRLFVEASAGTGKTFLIEHYVVRTILETISQGNTFSPKKLVLITFTRAVAHELRRRLKKTLQNTAQILLQEDTSISYLRPFLKTDEFARKRLSRSLHDVIEHIDDASITTIHGFCDSILSLGEERRFLTEKERLEWLQEYVEEIDDQVMHPAEWKKLSQYFKYDQKKLLLFLNSLLEVPQKDFVRASYEKLDETIAFIQEASGPLVRNTEHIFSEASTQYVGTYKYNLSTFFHGLGELLLSKNHDALLSMLEIPVSLEELFSAPKKKASIAEKAYIDFLVTHFSAPLHIVLTPTFLLKKLLVRCQESFFAFLEKSQVKTPESIVKSTRTLCQENEFCTAIASSVEWLIVDEFQDTDAVQNEIFSRIFVQNHNWKGKLLFVGDPKQAIYAFRKADVYSYIQAQKHFSSDEIRTLSVNFRASPSVVAAQNCLFASSSLFYLPKTSTTIQCHPSTSGEKTPDIDISDGRGAVHFFMAKDRLGRKRRWPHDAIEKRLFSWISDEVIHLLHHGVSLSQQAVLVKDRYQARRLGDHFTSKNIPFFSWRVDSVLDSFAYEWLKKAFDLISDPHDKKKLISLLFFSKSYELCRDIEAGNLRAWALCSSQWCSVFDAFQRRGISGLSRALFQCKWNGEDRLDGWREHLIDFEHLIELLSALEKRLPNDIEAYKDACNRLGDYFTDVQDLLVRRADPDYEGVRILTMHKSKGLEFDVVFTLGCVNRTPSQDDIAFDEADSEKLRQLYVAVTRAKKRCYIPAIFEEDGKKVALGQASPLELFLALRAHKSSADWHTDLYSHLPCIGNECDGLTSPHITYSLAEEERNYSLPLKEAIVLPSLPFLSGTSSRVESFSTLQKAAQFSSGSSTLFGIQFHEAISALLTNPHLRSCDALEAWLKKRGVVSPEMPQLVLSALEVKLPWENSEIVLQEIPSIDIRTECPFFDAQKSGYIRGTIDVLFLYEKKIFIIDWKTNVVTAPLESFVREHGYDRQYEIYKNAALRAFDNTFTWGGFFFVFVRQLHDNSGIFLCSEKSS